ncbi:hypothetical protein C8R45DRAFT_1036300 [Mycena sanguinolenta]|nr:hypothetical protein C8R45DRAFT_1036300 [Mycena sanguinolenta]
MAPIPDQNLSSTYTECSNGSRTSTCTIIFIAFLLVFYALALWDRWLNLKLRESQKLQAHTSPQRYGATENLTRPRFLAPSDGRVDKNMSVKQKRDQKSSPLTPPS